MGEPFVDICIDDLILKVRSINFSRRIFEIEFHDTGVCYRSVSGHGIVQVEGGILLTQLSISHFQFLCGSVGREINRLGDRSLHQVDGLHIGIPYFLFWIDIEVLFLKEAEFFLEEGGLIGVDLPFGHHHIIREARLRQDMGYRVGSPLVMIEQRQVSVGQNLDISRVSPGEYHIITCFGVFADKPDVGVIHRLFVVIDALDIDIGIVDQLRFGIAHLQEERVVISQQSCSDPVERGKLRIVRSEVALFLQHQVAEGSRQSHSCFPFGDVQFQFFTGHAEICLDRISIP